ncbi:MAG: DNA polymerase III subunit beta, partial [Bdellovibrio sp.]|nr:DNA polymerase III subunit beta [Bdellovibrio sp.]
VERTPFLDALNKTQSVVEKKNTSPILSNILCSVRGKELSIFATDLEVGVKIKINIDESENSPQKEKLQEQTPEKLNEERVSFPAKYFLDIVRELPHNQKIIITKKENNWVELLSGKSKFNMVSLSPDEFPTLPEFENKKYIDARVSSLKQMIDSTAFAISTDATRYTLTGVYFEPLDQQIMRMTALDGHRLSFVDQEVFLKTPNMKSGIIIPKKGLGELRKLIEESSSSVGLAIERGNLFATYLNTHLFIRLIEGEFPDYRQVIPSSKEKTIKIKKEEFNSALKRASLFANEKSKAVRFSLQDTTLTITTSNPDMGEAKEEVEVEYSGEPTEVGFNFKYLLDYLAIVQSEYLEFSMKDQQNAGILRGVGQQYHTYVIMPMRA